MSKYVVTATPPSRRTINDCWNKIGVYGDASCPELPQHIHCRNCPVYSAAAVELLNSELPIDHLDRWTRHVAQKRRVTELDTHSVVVYRLGAQWLALPTTAFMEIASLRTIHSLPHRRNGVILGLANIRGELLVCVSLRQVLGVEEIAVERTRDEHRAVEGRLLVIRQEGHSAVCPVDEVYGIERFHPRELRPVPTTVAKATATYTKSVLPWHQKSVGVLDEQLLFHTFNRSLALATLT
jgi:chemotaxis-related protein WspD